MDALPHLHTGAFSISDSLFYATLGLPLRNKFNEQSWSDSLTPLCSSLFQMASKDGHRGRDHVSELLSGCFMERSDIHQSAHGGMATVKTPAVLLPIPASSNFLESEKPVSKLSNTPMRDPTHSEEFQHKCAVVAAIEGIMAACDHRNCDPAYKRYGPAECYEIWSGTTATLDKGTPALDYASWKKLKDHPKGPIKYGSFIKVINSAHYFLTKCYRDAEKSKNPNDLTDLMRRLKTARMELVNKDGVRQLTTPMDYVEFAGGGPELRKEEILELTQHPSSGSGAVRVLIFDVQSDSVTFAKKVVQRLVTFLAHLRKPRDFYEMEKGCVQFFLNNDPQNGMTSPGSVPRKLPGGGIMVNLDPEELWEVTVDSGVSELVPTPSGTYTAAETDKVAQFIDASLSRISRKIEIRRKWGVCGEVAGRINGSFRRFLKAFRTNISGGEDQFDPYPGWDRNQLNAAESGSRLLRLLLFCDTYILWPAFGALTAALLLPVFWMLHAEIAWVIAAFAGAFLLASVGSRPCAATVSYAGTGLGGWAFAALFALSQGCVFRAGFIPPDSPRLVNTIVGGIIGSRAKSLYDQSSALFFIALVLSSLAIMFAAWGMRGPLQSSVPQNNGRSLRHIGKIALLLLIGTLPGALIAVELNLPRVLGDGVYAVSAISGLVAGGAFLGSTLIALNNKTLAIWKALTHALLVATLVLVAGQSTNHLLQILFSCAATGILHGSIFTLVFLLTRHISNSSKLAAVAASLEGVCGFVGFAIFHILQ